MDNLHVTMPESGTPQTLTLKTEWEKPHYAPLQMCITTDMDGLKDFVIKHREKITRDSVIAVSESKSEYSLILEPSEPFSTHVHVAILPSVELGQWPINNEKPLTPKGLRDMIRMRPHHFTDSTAEIVTALENFGAKFVAEMSDQESTSGLSKEKKYRRDIALNAPAVFENGLRLRIPISKGGTTNTINVSLRFEAEAGNSTGSVRIFLECPELDSQIEHEYDLCFDTLKYCVESQTQKKSGEDEESKYENPVWLTCGEIITAGVQPTPPVSPK